MKICDERLLKLMEPKELTQVDADEITERDNLAVVLRVERLEAIPGKDRIELVHLKDNGYTTICEKIHKVGDLVVFVKYDTVVPDNELFAWMKPFKFRVKAKSFTETDENGDVVKKIYSQGIVLPMKDVIDFTAKRDCSDGHRGEISVSIDKEFQTQLWNEGDDLTTFLGVKKYIHSVQGNGTSFGQMKSKGDFPTHILPKTDEPNVCSKVRALEELQGKPAYISIKVEGSSLTTMWDDDRNELMVCSRNNQIGEHETNKFWQAVNKHNLKDKLVEFPFAIQGELYGEGIQKNKLGIQGVDIAVFNIVNKQTRTRINYNLLVDICNDLNLPMVQVVFETDSFDWDFDTLQEFADKQVYPNGEIAEGVVVRPKEPFFSKVLKDDFSIKCINRNYSL